MGGGIPEGQGALVHGPRNRFAILLLGIFLMGLLVYSFWPDCIAKDCPPERDFDVSDMRIPEEFFPEGTRLGENVDEGGFNRPETLFMSTWLENELVVYYAMMSPSFRDAERLHRDRLNGQSDGKKVCTPEVYEAKFNIVHASEVTILCEGNIPRNFIARYQEINIWLSIRTTGQMILDDYSEIVQYIDQMMGEYLNIETGEVTEVD